MPERLTPPISEHAAKKTRRENPTKAYLKPGMFIEPAPRTKTGESNITPLVDLTLRSHENE